MDVQYRNFRFHPFVRIKFSFKAIGNLNAPDKPISYKNRG